MGYKHSGFHKTFKVEDFNTDEGDMPFKIVSNQVI